MELLCRIDQLKQELALLRGTRPPFTRLNAQPKS